ncbi:F-box domain-containing protein [Pseudomonas sp. IT-P258]|uniref:RHS repeat-associated core domain-containing protein n=1 Tax=Pseudomonas sp. IT-P258 TaxID=3026447 RepID=UPI0039DF9C7D
MLPTRETLLCRYHYDPLDRLVDCTPSAQAPTRRFYLKDRLATEIQDAVQRSIIQHDDQLLAQQQRQNGAVEARLLATDQQRSVLNVLDVARPHPLAYSPYGHRPAESGLLSLLGFNGERPDPVTGCYLLGNGYRAFNPVLMRFNSPDSWSPFGEGGLNGYAYCVGDPVNQVDPTGHVGFMKVLKWIGKTFGLRQSKNIGLEDMPNEVLGKIFDNLQGKDLANVSRTSKRMNESVEALSSINMTKLIADAPEQNLVPLITDAGFGRIKGVAPSSAVQSGVTFQDAQRKYPYPMVQVINNRAVHFGPLPPGISRREQSNALSSDIRSGNWF